MPIKTVCPECQTSYQLSDQQAGKSVRCKECQTVFVVEAARTKQSNVSARRDAPSRARRRDDDEGDEPQVGRTKNVKKKSALPLIVGGAVVGVVLLFGTCVGIAYVFWPDDKNTKNSKAEAPPQFKAFPKKQAGADGEGFKPPPGFVPPQMDTPPDEGVPVVAPPVNPTPPAPKPAEPTPPKPAEPKGSAAEEPRRAQAENGKDEPENKGRITADTRDRVKRATVYIRVKMADGTQASGSGFFGCKEAHNIILTNAHVVGMLSPESLRPQEVEIIVNSGEANEWKTKARVLGVDRASDLAVLDIGAVSNPIPEPLLVKSTDRLRHLDEVFVFGFPLGEGLGKEITIRPSSVSAFRHDKQSGVLKHVQVNGGMDHGNSGGPVVDNNGNVVGVAVAIVEGTQIHFMIPGQRVQAILSGRIADLNIEQSYFMSEKKVAVPVTMNTIDPRNLIKEVGLEVWTGNPPPNSKKGTRPAATTQPAPQEGDSPHKYIKMRYTAPEGKAQIVLPELPKGKVYWQQAKWTNTKGETHWADAAPMKLPSEPVARKDANLVLHYTQGAERTMELTIDNFFKVSGSEDSDALRIRTAATFKEKVSITGAGGTTLLLRYKFPPSCDVIVPDGRSRPKTLLEPILKELPNAITSLIQLDNLGNIQFQSSDMRALRQRPTQLNAKQIETMKEFHEMIQQALESVAVSMPPGGSAKPLHTWKGERLLPIDTPGKTLSGKIGVTFTYLGTRKREGREEAVIHMDGQLRSRDDTIGGRVEGRFQVDLASGQTRIADTTAKLQLKAILQRPGEDPHELRLLDTIKIHMQRKL